MFKDGICMEWTPNFKVADTGQAGDIARCCLDNNMTICIVIFRQLPLLDK
jgi:hypothetical protein